MQGIFSSTTYLQFWAFLLVYVTILEEITRKFLFISSVHTWKNIILYSKKKNGDLGTMPYYLSKIASVEKIWTLFNCISWCLTDHMTIWTKFVNDNGGLLEYLLSGMWSFGDLCIFGCKNIRRLLFFVILRLGLLWCHQDHRIFSYFFITLPHLKPKHRNQDKHLWSVGHHKILSPEIQKSYFWQPYFPYWWSKKIFFGKWCFSNKNNIPQNEENMSWSVWKNFQFCLILTGSDS